MEWYSYDLTMIMAKDTAVDYVKGPNSFLSNKDNFVYYDASNKRFISNNDWRDNIHYKERMMLNADTTLPSTPKLAEISGFVPMDWYAAMYHGSLEGNLKYVHPDGREAIYEPKSQIPDGYSLMTLDDNSAYGPTYNYINASQSTMGHYLFDMLPYFWWGNTPK